MKMGNMRNEGSGEYFENWERLQRRHGREYIAKTGTVIFAVVGLFSCDMGSENAWRIDNVLHAGCVRCEVWRFHSARQLPI
jgi:hypothetical protein